MQRLSARQFLVFELCLYISCMLLYSYEERKKERKEEIINNSQFRQERMVERTRKRGKKASPTALTREHI